jgi:hypothetical protein
MYLYSYCKGGSVIFAPFHKLDKAVDYAITSVEAIIGRNAPTPPVPKKKPARNNGGGLVFDPGDVGVDDPAPALHIDFAALGIAPQPVMPRKKGKSALISPDNKDELEKLYKQIDFTKTDKTLKNMFKTIQMVEDYLKFTKGSGAVLHNLEEVKLPNIKERDAYDRDIGF